MEKLNHVVNQDGGKFYDDETGLLLFESSLYVKDFDLETAKQARHEFITWCVQRNLVVIFATN